MLQCVSDWNTFFDLPTNGTAFSSVEVVGNVVKLYGGSGIATKNNLFLGNNNLLKIIDYAGCIVEIGDSSFKSAVHLTEINFPEITAIGSYGFYNCNLVTTCNAPKIRTLSGYVFFNWLSITEFNFPLLESAGAECFYYAGNSDIDFPLLSTIGVGCFDHLILTSINLPSLTSADEGAFIGVSALCDIYLPLLGIVTNNLFAYCSGPSIYLPEAVSIAPGAFSSSTILSYNLPKVTSVDGGIFWESSGVININFSSLVNFGPTTGWDGVLSGFLGETFTLTIPASVMTCNDGSPDTDIEIAIDDNTVTIFDPDNNQIYP